MAQATGLTQTYNVGSSGGNREDLEDKIWDLFAEDTWALTNLERISADATFHEWLKDSLDAAAQNTQLEGDEATFATLAPPTRVGNYCQISRKTFLVSGTQEAVSKAGRARESARQTMKKMRELKNDMEYAITRNQGSAAGNGGVSGSARRSAGMESWLSTNEIPTATSTAGTTPGYISGIVAAPTDATQVAMSEGVFKSALAAAWAQGGDPRVVLTNSSSKATIDGFSGIATRQVDVGRQQQATIIGAANVYVSSFGVHKVVLHRHVRGNTVMALDPDYWAVAFLRRPFMEQLAKTGDGFKWQMIAEFTLVCRNEAASAKVVGVL